MFNLKVNEEIELRLVHPNYAYMHFELSMSNKEHIGKWLDWVYKYQTVQDSYNFFAHAIDKYKNGEGVECLIFYKGIMVGSCGFVNIKKNNNSGEIGYWISKEYSGKGIMTESVRSLIDYGFNFLNLNKIIIRAAVGNDKSANIARKLGFNQDAVLRDEGQINGKYHDAYYFSLLKSEFQNN